MTTTAEAEWIATALEIITDPDFRADGTLNSRSSGSFIPSTSTVSGQTVTPLALTITTPTTVDMHYVDGDTVQETDLVTYIASASLGAVVPTLGDSLTYNGVTYAVLKVFPFNIGNVVACYALALRS